jgi:hypothetical protein
LIDPTPSSLIYDSRTSLCADRPIILTIGASVLALDAASCADNLDNLTVDISSLENGIYIAQIATVLATINR